MSQPPLEVYDPACQRCPRLADYLEDVRRQYPAYHARPVAPFGAEDPKLVIVGLAPGMHGANATGRPFTGDHAGLLLYRTLFRYGYSNQPNGTHAGDGLTLRDCRITNAVKCVPPANKPLPAEIATCNQYLRRELASVCTTAVVLALGRIAHAAVLRAFDLKPARYGFAHGAVHALPDAPVMVDSYHCSRYNTQTGRLTEPMFHAVFATIQSLIDETHSDRRD